MKVRRKFWKQERLRDGRRRFCRAARRLRMERTRAERKWDRLLNLLVHGGMPRSLMRAVPPPPHGGKPVSIHALNAAICAAVSGGNGGGGMLWVEIWSQMICALALTAS